MSNNIKINTIRINELPESDILSDSDVLIKEDSSATHKIKLSALINYIKDHSSIIDAFISRPEINKESGIAPLDENRKIRSENINFGAEQGMVYEGSEGALLKSNMDDHISDESNPHNVTKKQLGLGNVDNTSDIDKPISTLQQEALDLKADAGNAVLTGIPTAPTAPADTNSAQIATTAFVQSLVKNIELNEIISATEPTDQSDGQYWIKEY